MLISVHWFYKIFPKLFTFQPRTDLPKSILDAKVIPEGCLGQNSNYSHKMENEKKTIHLEPSSCNGCEGCIELNPEIFGWDDATDRPFLITNEASEEEIRDVMACCPGSCITLQPES